MSGEQELKPKESSELRISGGGEGKGTPAGFEGMDKSDMKIARLSLVQGLSKIAVKGKATMGKLYNNISEEVLGDSVEIIPLFMFKTRAKFDVDRGLLMMSRDNLTVTMAIDEFEHYLGQPVEDVPNSANPEVRAIDWDGDNPPEFCQVYNFPSLLIGRLNQFPLSLSMMKTAAKVAQTFLSMARYSGEDMFARVYKVSAKIEHKNNKPYAVPVIEFVRRCTDEEYVIAKEYFETLYKRKADIDVELEDGKTEQ